ncbi:fibronectin type III domain-containing protein [Demequina sp. NBRC 110052]|uniref:fibronectin type III domain-containing protein n=1 Tax=Demequina sp. NBRC 110052 TaxID=1570341 RepID=UPI000A004196|nr:fibronectin type III domain-containing protein [Demequina sp. NBRC 110052]
MRTPEMSDAAPRPSRPVAEPARSGPRAAGVLTVLAAVFASLLVAAPASGVDRVALVQAGTTIDALEVTGDGRYVYAAGGWFGKDNHEIAVLRAADRTIVERFEIDFNVADLELDNAAGLLYVARYESGGWGGVSYHDDFTGEQLGMIATGDTSAGIELNEESGSLYIANGGAGSLWRVDTTSYERTGGVALDRALYDLALSPDGSMLALIGASGLILVDEETLEVTHRDSSFAYTSGVSFGPTGDRVFVVEPGEDTLTVIDAEDGSVERTIHVPGGPVAVEVAPRGDVAYVVTPHTATRGTLTVVSVETGSVLQVVRVTGGANPNPRSIVLDPEGEEAYVGVFGTGEVGVFELLTAPLAPTSTALSATETSLTLTWEPPVYDGGADVTGYTVSYRATGEVSFNAVALGPAVRSFTLDGLTRGEVMQFRVRAANERGEGAESPLLYGAASAPPGVPSDLQAQPGDGQVELTWANSTDDGGSAVTDYRIEYRAGGGDWRVGSTTPGGNAPRRVVHGLTNGTEYEFRVSSINLAGASEPSESISATPFVIPAAPTAVTARPGDSSSWVTWDAAPNSIVEAFNVTVRQGGTVVAEYSIAPHLRGLTLEALENDATYSVTVTAVTPYGDSAASAPVEVTPVASDRPNAMARVLAGGFPRMFGFMSTPDGERLLLPHYLDDEVHVIDTATGSLVERLTTFPIPGAGVEPATAIVSPDGRTVYTLDFSGASVTHLDLATGELRARAKLSGLPTSGALAPDGSRLWVVNNFDDGLEVLDAVTLEGIAEVSAPYRASGAAFSADGARVYVGSSSPSVRSVAVYDAQALTLVAEIEVAGGPVDLDVTPDGSRLVVISESENVLTVFDLRGSADPVVIPLGGVPQGVATSPDSTVAYVSLLSGGGETAVVDLGTYEIVDRIPTPGTPEAIHVSSASGALYVSLVDQGVAELVEAAMPGAPSGLTATRGDGEVSLAWTAPADDGGGAVLDYVVEYADSTEQWQVLSRSRSSATSATVSGLANGELHGFRVSAVNGAGTGRASEVATATPAAVPGAVTELEATARDQALTVTWEAPVSDGGEPVTGYRVELREVGDDTVLATSTPTEMTATMSGLVNGAAYELSVIAINAVGDSAAATVEATPRTVPGAPTGLVAARGNGQLSLSWTASIDDGGDDVFDYVIEIREAGGTWGSVDDDESATTSATLTGLTNGTAYEVRVSAVNGAGKGAASGVASGVPATAPGAVENLIATPGNGEIALAWDASEDDGGEAVTGYRVQWRIAGGTWSTAQPLSSRRATLAGLANGEEYEFRVWAVNAVGDGLIDAVLATPRTSPDAPTALVATGGDGEIALTWNAPGDDGGDAVSDYVIELREAGDAWETVDDGESASTAATVTGLTNGITYEVRVSAVNAAGPGLSAEASATPEALPSAPLALEVTPADGALSLAWQAPADDGGRAVSHYLIEHRVEGGVWEGIETAADDGTAYELGGLVNGTFYEVRVSARNSVGVGPAIEVVAAAPRTTPDAPTGLDVTPGADRVQVRWVEPSDGGSAITGYLIEYRLPGGSWMPFVPGGGAGAGGVVSAPVALAAVADTEATILGLTPETTYEVRVTALNEAGRSAASAPVSFTTLAAGAGGLPVTGPGPTLAFAALAALVAASAGLALRRRAVAVRR